MSATPLRAGAGMCRVPLPHHASAPHRVSLATLPVRSGVRNDGEKITIRVAEPDDLGVPGMTTTPASLREARERSRDSCQQPAQATSHGLRAGHGAAWNPAE